MTSEVREARASAGDRRALAATRPGLAAAIRSALAGCRRPALIASRRLASSRESSGWLDGWLDGWTVEPDQ